MEPDHSRICDTIAIHTGEKVRHRDGTGLPEEEFTIKLDRVIGEKCKIRKREGADNISKFY